MNTIYSIYEGILSNIDDTLKQSDKFVNVDFIDLLNAKSKEDYINIAELLKNKISSIEKPIHPYKEIHGATWVKTNSNLTYVAFIHEHNTIVIYIGSEHYYFRVIWSLTANKTSIRHHSKEYGYGFYNLNTKGEYAYKLPKVLEKSFNKLSNHADNI